MPGRLHQAATRAANVRTCADCGTPLDSRNRFGYCKYHRPTTGLSHRERVFALLCEAAEADAPCPANAAIAAASGYCGLSSVSRALTDLRDTGRIVLLRQGEFRVVEIVTTGKRTADQQDRGETRVVKMRRPIAGIIRVAADTAALSVAEVTGRGRARLFIRPRVVACHFAHAEGWSFAAIGRAMGGRDHSTIIHSCDLVDMMIRTDALFARLHRRTEAALAGVAQPTGVVNYTGPARYYPEVARLADALPPLPERMSV